MAAGSQFLQKTLITLIKAYQLLISAVTPARCRFWPTCSEYCIEAIRHFGIFKGVLYSMKRLLCCHPYHPGGYDPVINEQKRDNQ